MSHTGINLLPYIPNPYKVLESINACDLFIATRFHAHVFGILSRIPLFSIAYSGKCQRLWQDLGLDMDLQVDRTAFSLNPSKVIEKLTCAQPIVLSEAQLALLEKSALESVSNAIQSVACAVHGIKSHKSF